jgi:hypothetical protein
MARDVSTLWTYAGRVFLENLVFDAVEPQRLGRFWEAAVGGERLTDEPDGFETRLIIADGPELDLCFQRVPEPSLEPPRLHLDLGGGADQAVEVERLLRLGARHLDSGVVGTGQGDMSEVVLADPEGNPCRVLADRAVYADAGPLAALRLESADPGRDVEFWSWLTGWTVASDATSRTLRHPSLRGTRFEICPELVPKAATKNRRHLDIRLEIGDDPDDVAAGIVQRGGCELHPEWGELPWRLFADPSGNEFCVLPARTAP